MQDWWIKYLWFFFFFFPETYSSAHHINAEKMSKWDMIDSPFCCTYVLTYILIFSVPTHHVETNSSYLNVSNSIKQFESQSTAEVIFYNKKFSPYPSLSLLFLLNTIRSIHFLNAIIWLYNSKIQNIKLSKKNLLLWNDKVLSIDDYLKHSIRDFMRNSLFYYNLW